MVNVWASWCGPCRFEFPTLQKLSAKYGKKVAFLGVNSHDSDDAAKTFLDEVPVPYPSYTDADQSIKTSLGARGFPDTAFYNSAGELVLLKQGQYPDEKALAGRYRTLRAGRRMRKRIIGSWTPSPSSPSSPSPCSSPSCCCRPAGCSPCSAPSAWSPRGVVALESNSSTGEWIGPALIALGLLSLVTFYFVTRKVIAAHRDEHVRTGTEEMVGSTAEVRNTLDPEGQVWSGGTLWSRAARRRRRRPGATRG